MRVPVGDLHAGVQLLPSRPVESARTGGGAAGGGGCGGWRSHRVQQHNEHRDFQGAGSKSGSVSPPSKKTQSVVPDIADSKSVLCFKF